MMAMVMVMVGVMVVTMMVTSCDVTECSVSSNVIKLFRWTLFNFHNNPTKT